MIEAITEQFIAASRRYLHEWNGDIDGEALETEAARLGDPDAVGSDGLFE